ncbi:hypothetical protein B0H11DRAFT_2319986 [Mycena galericulata]|nr:hypothetical protein B0H11DRAFT_2319986 [Mycena galericulata]
MNFAARRCVSTLPTEFEALFREKVPLDAVVARLAPSPPAPPTWPIPPPRKSAQTLARDIRAFIAQNDVKAALAVLRDAPYPYPRLLAHAAVHALLRVSETRRAGALLLAFVSKHATVKSPHMHPKTLAATINGLISLVPREQTGQEWVRSAIRPRLLRLDPEIVSNPNLRTALALHIQAHKLFIPRQVAATAALWQALLNQREWIAAALIFTAQVSDRRLRYALPALLRDPDAKLTPHAREHLRRRLALLRHEGTRPHRALFAQLCNRIAGVINNITRRPESGFIPRPRRDGDDDDNVSLHSATSRNLDFDAAPGAGESPVEYEHGSARPAKTPLYPARAKQHARGALQALAIIATEIDARAIPFPDVSAWVAAVGSIPPALSPLYVYALADAPAPAASSQSPAEQMQEPQLHPGRRPTRVPARAYLRQVLEGYATRLPRTPHLLSMAAEAGFVRRGLADRNANANADGTNREGDQNVDADAEGGGREKRVYEGTWRSGRAKWEAAMARENDADNADAERTITEPPRRRQTVPPADPAEAADDSFMPPPNMATYEALLGVFLRGTPASQARGIGRMGALYEAAPVPVRARAQRGEDGEGAGKGEEEAGVVLEGEAEAEAWAVQLQHWHAPRSPNNPRPSVAYPPHPLDFGEYPAAPWPGATADPFAGIGPPEELVGEAEGLWGDAGGTSSSDGNAHAQVDDAPAARMALAYRVIDHMLHLRSPPLPPWESPELLQLLARRRPAFVGDPGGAGDVAGRKALWGEVWAGAAQARRDAAARARVVGEWEGDRGGGVSGGGRDRGEEEDRNRDTYGEPEALGVQSSGWNREPAANVERAELDRLNRRLAAREREREARYGGEA